MKTIQLILIAAIAAFTFQNCSTMKNLADEQLTDKWMLKSINGQQASEVFASKQPNITFDFKTNQVSGNAGCNGFTGKFTYEKGQFTAANLASTMMACPNMEGEKVFHKLLGAPSVLLLNGNGELVFLQDKKQVLVFTRSKPVSASDIAGTWVLQSMNGASVNAEEGSKVPTATFDASESRVSGNTGCNNFSGTFALDKGVLDIKPLRVTSMACLKMEREHEFIKTFTGKINVELENGRLTLRKENRTIMVFVRE